MEEMEIRTKERERERRKIQLKIFSFLQQLALEWEKMNAFSIFSSKSSRRRRRSSSSSFYVPLIPKMLGLESQRAAELRNGVCCSS